MHLVMHEGEDRQPVVDPADDRVVELGLSHRQSADQDAGIVEELVWRHGQVLRRRPLADAPEVS